MAIWDSNIKIKDKDKDKLNQCKTMKNILYNFLKFFYDLIVSLKS